jgi:hypothetical protein
MIDRESADRKSPRNDGLYGESVQPSDRSSPASARRMSFAVSFTP